MSSSNHRFASRTRSPMFDFALIQNSPSERPSKRKSESSGVRNDRPKSGPPLKKKKHRFDKYNNMAPQPVDLFGIDDVISSPIDLPEGVYLDDVIRD